MSATDAAGIRERVADLLASCDPGRVSATEFLGRRFDAGLAWVHFPPGHGGLGADPALQRGIEDTFAEAGAPRPDIRRNPIGLGIAAATIRAHGTPDQCTRYLRPLYAGEEIWAQLFSEPGAGSDLAGVATRATPVADGWAVTGQKVWNTLAHAAHFGLLLARTDPEVPKHRGLTFFVCDMRSPGVEVRPLRQITGEAEFNEVYLTDVRIPDAMRLGEVGGGWRVAMTAMSHERVSVSSSRRPRQGSGPISLVMSLLEQGNATEVQLDRAMSLWIEAEALRLTNLRAGEMRRHGVPGPEGSVGKLAFSGLNQRITELCLDLLGADGMLYPSGYELGRSDEATFFDGDLHRFFLRSRANSIEGGTTEILRSVLAEQVLGLPAEPRTDKALPWREVPR